MTILAMSQSLNRNFTIQVNDSVDIITMYLVFSNIKYKYIYGSRKEDFRKTFTFYHIAILAPSQGLNPRLRGHKFHNFGNQLHRNHNYAFNFFTKCVGEEKIFENLEFFFGGIYWSCCFQEFKNVKLLTHNRKTNNGGERPIAERKLPNISHFTVIILLFNERINKIKQ